MLKLSVIIPTLNEAAYLPGLLDALEAQTCQADEIVVADAGSTDGTADLARARGAIVVRGGKPGPGRNAGARAAKGDVFLFFDADVRPPSDFVERALDEFTRSGYAVATSLIGAWGGDLADQLIMEALNLYMQALRPISLRAPGFCILARRELHQAISGFDESLKLCEDYDYVRRASDYGKFGILTGVHIPVSMRRLDKEGFTRLAFKCLWCELCTFAGKPVRSTPFDYEFGAFRPPTTAGRSLFRLGRMENPIPRWSNAGLGRLSHWMELEPADVLDRYWQQSLALVRDNDLLNEGWSKLKTLPYESARFLDPIWLRPRREGGARGERENRDV